MFGFMRTSPTGDNINYKDYTFEGDGHLYAFQEAFRDLAEIDGMIARMNNRGVNAYAEGYHKGGLTAAQEAANVFMESVVKEGFFGDMKDKLIKLLKKLKEKIKAFFHSAVQYFDSFFKDGAEFAEKYEDELRDKDLDGFKVRMYTYKALSKDYSKTVANWEDMKKAALAEAKKQEIDIATEAFGFDRDDWVGVLVALMETFYWQSLDDPNNIKATDTFTPGKGKWKQISQKEYERIYYTEDSETGNRIEDYGDSENYGEDEKPKSIAGKIAERAKKNSSEDKPKDESPKEKEVTKTSVKSITSSQRKEIRRICMHTLCKIDSADNGKWTKQLKKAMRDGQGSMREITPDISDMIDVLKNSKEQLSDIKDIGDKFQDEFDDEIDKVNGMDKSGDNGVRVRNHVAVFTEAKNCFMEYFQVLKSVMIERNNAYKSCLSAALHYNAKSK